MAETHESALGIGGLLQEYEIESILGHGGFGITYLAKDIHLHKKVVIKEFLPNDIAVRKERNTVVPKSQSDQDTYDWGMSRFLLEAKTLAKFNHPNIVRINRFFEANNTGYFVMDYEEGEDLQNYLQKRGGTLNEEDIYNIIMPILDGLREVHSHDYLHRDIKPGNIYIRSNGSPLLIDFGASRVAMGVKSKSLSVVLTEGYAPKEQYSSTSQQGPYTDIYAIGAVMYKMTTGITPTEASGRVDKTSDGEADPYKRLQDQANLQYSGTFKKTVDWALSLSAKDRPQSVRELQDALMGQGTAKEPSTQTETATTSQNIPEKPKRETSKQEIKDKIIMKEGCNVLDIGIFVLIASCFNAFGFDLYYFYLSVHDTPLFIDFVNLISVSIFYFIVLKNSFKEYLYFFLFILSGFVTAFIGINIIGAIFTEFLYSTFNSVLFTTFTVFFVVLMINNFKKLFIINIQNILKILILLLIYNLIIDPSILAISPWTIPFLVLPLHFVFYKYKNRKLKFENINE